MTFKYKLLAAITFSTFVAFTFQNCGQGPHLDQDSEIDALASDSIKIRQMHCARCHQGENAQAEPSRILDDRYLVENQWVVPGDPTSSRIYTSLFSNMPLNSPRLNDSDIETMEAWIISLADDGTQPAKLSLSDGPSYDFGSVVSGAASEHTFTLTNEGEREAIALTGTGLSAPFEYKGGVFPGTGGTCLVTLAPKASCTVVVSYTPFSSGTFFDAIEILYLDRVGRIGRIPALLRMAVTGTASGGSFAHLALSPSPFFDFGTIASGGSVDRIFNVTNHGAATAQSLAADPLTSGFAFKGGSYPGIGGTCGSSLAAAGSCSMVLSFSPSSSGLKNSTLNLKYSSNSMDSAASVTLQGTGSGTSSPVYYTEIRSILDSSSCNSCHGGQWGTTFSALRAFKTEGDNPAIDPGNANARFIVRITSHSVTKPRMGTGIYGSLTSEHRDRIIAWITAGAPNDPTAAPAVLSLSDDPTLDFGNVASGSSVDRTLTVQNTGASIATEILASGLSAPFSFKDGAFPGAGGNCADSLAPGSQCTVVISFTPTSAGTSNASLQFSYNDSVAAQTASRALRGQGTGAPLANLTLSDSPSYSFGVTSVGTTKEKTFTLTNNGQATATAIAAVSISAPFAFKGGSFPGSGGNCTNSLQHGSNCKIVVTYSPANDQNHSANLRVNYHNGAASKNVQIAMTGTGAGGTTPVYYSEVRSILDSSSCNSCHNAHWGATYTALKGFMLEGSTPAIDPGNANSRFIVRITTHSTAKPQMGVGDYGSLTAANRTKIINWIVGGALDDPMSSPAVLAISHGPTYDFGTVTSGQSKDHTFTIENTGGSNATTVSPVALSAPFSFKGGSFPGAGGTCTSTILVGASCTIAVTFAPTSATISDAVLRLNYNDGTKTTNVTRALKGTGQGVPLANLALSDGPTYDFGTVSVGSAKAKTFTVTNNGNAKATALAGASLAAPFRYKGGSFPGTGGNCSANLNAGASCTIAAEYAPTANGNNQTTLRVNYNDGAANKSVSVTIKGLGVGAGPAVYYTEVRAILDSSCMTCHNSSSEWGSSFSSLRAFTKNGTPLAIEPGNANSRFILRISGDTAGPRMGTGSYGNLSNANRDKIISWILQGALNDPQASPAVLAINGGSTFDFGSVASGQTKDQTFTVSNSGGSSATNISPASFSAPFSFKGGSFPGQGGTCEATLAKSASCTVVVRFAPTSTTVSTGTLRLNYNDGTANKSASRPIKGTGTGPALAQLAFTDAAPVSFGIIKVAQVGSKTLTVTNSGAASATAMAAVALTAPYRFKGGTYPGTGGNCAATLNAGANCKIVVEYAPTANGTHNQTLRVNYNDGAGAKNITIAMTGQGSGGGTPIYYSQARAVLDGGSCNSCHGGEWGTSYASLKSFKKEGSTPAIDPGKASSRFIIRITEHTTAKPKMGATPYGTLTAANVETLVSWILQGAADDPAAPPAVLAISPTGTFDFGNVNSGTTKDQTFTVNNTGGKSASAITATALSAPFSFKGGTYPGQGGTCGATLNAGASCTVIARFSPTTATTSNGSLKLNYNDGSAAKSVSRAIKGTGVGVSLANLSLSDSPIYDFGITTSGSVKARNFVLQNSGSAQAKSVAAVALTAPFRFKGGSYPGTGGNCGTALNAGKTCTLVVEYAPTANGNHSGTLRINYNNGASAQNVAITIKGKGAGAGPAIYYSQVKAILDSSCMSCHSTEWGSTFTALRAFKKSGTTPAIDPGKSTSRFIVRITTNTPKAQMGTGSFGNLSAANRDKIVNWILQGALNDPGAAPANLAINKGPTLDFGTVTSGNTKDETLTISNSGGSTATNMSATALKAPFSFKGGTYPGQGGSCGTSLAKATNCTIVVRFAPTSATTSTDTIKINYNDGTANTSSSRPIKGTGQGVPLANLSYTNGTVSFGTVNAGNSADRTVTLQNTGNAQAKSISGAALSAPFSYKGGSFPGTGGTCAATLNAGANCKIVVTYFPTANGNHTANLRVNYNNGASSQSATVGMSGTGAGAGTPVYYSEIAAILDRSSCNTCHGTEWNSYSKLMAFKKDHPSAPARTGPAIVKGNLAQSRFAKRITTHNPPYEEQMGTGSYGSLTSADKQKILDWIAQGASNNPAGTIAQDYRPLAGDRYYIASTLYNVFGETTTSTNQIRTPLMARADLFGGPCHMQDSRYVNDTSNTRRKYGLVIEDTCTGVGTMESRIEATMNPIVSTVGEATRQKACMHLLNEPSLAATALTRAGLTAADDFTGPNITKAYQRFYPGSTPSANSVAALAQVGQQAEARAGVKPAPGRTKRFEGWRYVLLSICLSSGWQTP